VIDVTASSSPLRDVREDVAIVPIFEGDSPTGGVLNELNALTSGRVAELFERGEISGKRARWTLLHDLPGISTRRILFYGAGDPAGLSSTSIQRLGGAAVRTLKDRAARSIAFLITGRLANPRSAQSLVEGALLGNMSGALYATAERPSDSLERIVIVHPADSSGIDEAVRVGRVMGQATNLVRALCFEPSNNMTPIQLAGRAEQVASEAGLGFEALGEDEMKSLGMGALLGVSRGSQEPARLIILDYKPRRTKAIETAPSGSGPDDSIALIGKGITFDSGGISIKPAERMDEMKYDMAGGAAVIGAMQIISRLQPDVRVLGLIPASENLPSGRAVKPGDVVRSFSGKTIEVANTDAEGRLVLCDAINYALTRGAKTIVDAATLTGAVAVALGEVRAAVMGNDDNLLSELDRAGEQCGERVWRLPMDKEYAELIKSDIADVRNVGNRTGGSITAGWFLRHFIGDAKWAHLDIAGTAWTEKEKPYLARGATGFGTRLMANFVLNRAKPANHSD